MIADVILVGTLIALLYGMVVAYVRLSSTAARIILVTVVACVAVVMTFIAYPSEPQQWHVSNLVIFMVDEVFNIFAILGNILTGAVLFALVSSSLYLFRKRDSRDARADFEM
jgi:formate/nitrite transporter FocA (FNT family)